MAECNKNCMTELYGSSQGAQKNQIGAISQTFDRR